MASSCFIGTESSKPSSVEDWLSEIKKAVDEDRKRNGEPRFMIIGIDYGFAYEEDNGEIPVVIGDWRDG